MNTSCKVSLVPISNNETVTTVRTNAIFSLIEMDFGLIARKSWQSRTMFRFNEGFGTVCYEDYHTTASFSGAFCSVASAAMDFNSARSLLNLRRSMFLSTSILSLG